MYIYITMYMQYKSLSLMSELLAKHTANLLIMERFNYCN